MNITDINITLDHLPEGSVLKLYEVDDEDKTFFCQVGFILTGKRDSEGTLSKGLAFSACTCPEGFTSIAFSLTGTKPSVCEHVRRCVLHEQKKVREVLAEITQNAVRH